MSDEYLERTIAHLVEEIRQGELELAENKRVVNRLCTKANKPPMFSDADAKTVASLANIRRDQWYGQPISGAIREYLGMRRASSQGPATVNEIFEALSTGGFSFEAKDDENAKRGIRICLTKSSAIFHRLPDGKTYGLLEWYPEAKARKEKEPETENGSSAATDGNESQTEVIASQPSATTASKPESGVPRKRGRPPKASVSPETEPVAGNA